MNEVGRDVWCSCGQTDISTGSCSTVTNMKQKGITLPEHDALNLHIHLGKSRRKRFGTLLKKVYGLRFKLWETYCLTITLWSQPNSRSILVGEPSDAWCSLHCTDIHHGGCHHHSPQKRKHRS